jgi:uncharacterized protein YukE
VSVTEVDAERVFRCAYRIEQVAEDVRTAAARTARCFPEDWRGDAGIAYQQRLDETADRVRRMATAYDAAHAALMPYAQAVLEAQAMERQAKSLLGEAEAAASRSAAAAVLQGVLRLAGPDPAEGFRAAAARLQAEALEVEQRAAAVCAAALEDEAARAPRTGWWRAADRFAGDVANAGVDTVAGAASLLGNAWHALPGIGSRHSRQEARHGLVDSAVAAAQIWKIPIVIRDALEDGRPGLAAGALAGIVGPGKLSKLERHRIRDPFLAHKEAFREADRRAALAGHRIWRQTADEMGRNGVDLINEEARGGHVIDRHVAAPRGYLNQRNRAGRPKASTFRDRLTAEQLVNAVLREHGPQLADVYSLPPGETLELTSKFPFTTGRVTVKGSSRTLAAHAVTVVLKLEEGEPLVYTAFPEF